MKKSNKKCAAITILFLFTMLMGCLPMSEGKISVKAEEIYTNLEKPVSELMHVSELSKKDLAKDQVLYLSGRDIDNFDPTVSINVEDWIFTNQVYVGLTRQNLETLEFLPALASEWDVTEKGIVWTFKLQDNIPWVHYNTESDEVELVRNRDDEIRYVTSLDLVAGLERALLSDLPFYNKNNLLLINGASDFAEGYTEEIGGIKIISDSEIEIRLFNPYGYFDAITEMADYSAYPTWITTSSDRDTGDTTEDTGDAGDAGDADDTGDADDADDADSTDSTDSINIEEVLYYSYGPYVIKSYDPGQQITLTRNPYWDSTEGLPAPYLEEIHYDLSEDQDVLTQYKEGILNAVKLTAKEYDNAVKDPDLTADIRVSQGSCGYYLVFKHIDDLPLSSVVLRQAIAAAIDKDNLTTSLEGSEGKILNQFVPKNVRGASDYPKAIGIVHDPESAKIKIERAGLDVDSLDQIILLALESESSDALAEDIERDLRDSLELDVTLKTETHKDFYKAIWSKDNDGSFMYLVKNCLDYADAHSAWSFFGEEDTLSGRLQGDWQKNDFFEDVEVGGSITDVALRQVNYALAEDIIVNQDTVIVPLVTDSQAWLVDPKLIAEFSPLFPHFENWVFIK